MKHMSWKTIFLFCIYLVGYFEIFAQGEINRFTSDEDTLLIKTSKAKGLGLFGFYGVFIQLQDTSSLFDYAIDYPDSLLNIGLENTLA